MDEQEPAVAGETLASVEPIQPDIEIRDVRREEGPSAWVSSVGRLLSRHAEDGLPFAVLLVEIVDVAHLERSATPHDMHSLVARIESAIGRAMRVTDHLSRETLGRYWLVAPETNGTGARMLAERLARLVRTSATHRDVPLEVAIGLAVCPDDGTEAPALAARADLGVYCGTRSIATGCASGRAERPTPPREARGRGLGIRPAAVPPLAAASAVGFTSAGTPSNGLFAALPTIFVLIRTVSLIVSALAAPHVRSHIAPLCAYGPRSITGTVSRWPL